MCVPEILQMLATVQEFNDVTKYGPYCDLFFFHMKREREARVSTEGLFARSSLTWLASAGNLSFHTSQNDTKRSDETRTARHVSEPFFFSSCTLRLAGSTASSSE